MKRNNIKFLFALACFGFLASCSEDDDATRERSVKPVVTASQTSFSVVEGETVSLELTSDTPFSKTMEFKLELVGGTGSFRDYTVDNADETTVDDGMGMIGHKYVFPAFTTTSSIDITPLVDYYAESTETLVLKLTPMGNSNGLVAEGSDMITITVGNTTLDEVQTDLTWASTTNAHGNIVDIEYLGEDNAMHSLADVDFDILIFGPSNNFDGATGNHPEYATIDGSSPDGYYDFYIDLYDSTGAEAPARLTAYSPVFTVSKPGVWVHSFDLSNIWNSSNEGSASGSVSDVYVGYVEKAGTTFTLFNEMSDELASGRAARKVMPKNAVRTK